MTFDLISGLHMQIQTWHPPLWLCRHAKYFVKSGLTNVPKNANKTKNMHLFSIRIANYFLWIIRDMYLIALELSRHGSDCLGACATCIWLHWIYRDFVVTAGKWLTSWLSCLWRFLVFLSLSQVVSWVKCGTWLYRFLIFVVFLTLDLNKLSVSKQQHLC